MKFLLKTSSHFYPANQTAKYARLGFIFREVDRASIFATNSDEFAFVIDGSPNIEFTSLEELIEFCNLWDKVIVSQNGNGQSVLEIYDGDRE